MSEAYLVVDSVSKTLKGRDVLKGVSLEVPAGKIVGAAGPNGSGKTMLMRAIAGLVRPDAGGRSASAVPSWGVMWLRLRASACCLRARLSWDGSRGLIT